MSTTVSSSGARATVEVGPICLQLAPAVPMSQDQFFALCQQNPEMRFERTAAGELLIMAPIGGEGSIQNLSVAAQLYVWTMRCGQGKATGASGGFILLNGANRAPDAAWIATEQWAALTAEQRRKFLPLCPRFLIEVKSPSDSLPKLQDKMDEYVANGCRLAWLIDPERRQVHVYRSGQAVEVLDNPQSVSGDPELPGFVLDLRPVWEP